MLSPLKDMFKELNLTNSNNTKIEIISKYLDKESDINKSWLVYFLSGKKIKRACSSLNVKNAFFDAFNIYEWIFDESYAEIGDLAETISLLSPINKSAEISFIDFINNYLLQMPNMEQKEKEDIIKYFLLNSNKEEKFILLKLMTGNFRVGVNEKIVIKAISKLENVSEYTVEQNLLSFDPINDKDSYYKLINTSDKQEGPYPFFLSSPLDKEINIKDYQFEWKLDGIRAQIVKRDSFHIWSRNISLITNQFPEIKEQFNKLKDSFVLDGEILVEDDNKEYSFSLLQKRISRKTISKSLLKNKALFLAFDILELNGKDLRELELQERRKILEQIVPKNAIFTKINIKSIKHMHELRKSSKNSVEGLMVKKLDSKYYQGRVKGYWWKFKKDPLTIDAVLIYAHAGHGKRGGLFSSYTFGIWKENEIVPIANAYIGLNNKEIKELDKWIRSNTLQRFGPTRMVKQEKVFEIAFENIQKSTRHKSGIAVRFPRILRERTDKSTKEANEIGDILKLI